MAQNPVGWFEIYVQDMERARTFYASVLQVELQDLKNPGMDMWTFPMNPTGARASGALVKTPGIPSGGNSTLVYFHCEDYATEAGRVVEAGGQVQKKKFSIGEYGFIALALDTEGNMFGLHSRE